MPTATLSLRDETLSGAPPGGAAGADAWEWAPPTETLTVRELIRARVYQEVRDANAGRATRGRMLVTPAAREAALNGEPKKPRPVNWRAQFGAACEAFEQNRILVLVDDVQAESLDQTIDVATTSEVTFLKLTLLAGG